MRTRFAAVTLVLILMGLAGLSGSLQQAAHATSSPCEGISTQASNPPPGDPEPFISGSVLNATTLNGISGVVVKLYRCTSTAGTYITSHTTGSSGTFSFPSLAGPNWYYVEVDPTSGPGTLDPFAPTINPSALIDVGTGQSGLTMKFD